MRTCVYGRYAPGLTRCCGSFISYFFQIGSFFCNWVSVVADTVGTHTFSLISDIDFDEDNDNDVGY